MKQKILGILIVVIIALLVLPLTLAQNSNTINPVRISMQLEDKPARAPAGVLPDLEVVSIDFDPLLPTSADTVTITAIVKNVGLGQASPSQVSFSGDGVVLETITIGRLKAGKSASPSISVSFVAGMHTIEVFADPSDLIEEVNNQNNILKSGLLVSSVEPVPDFHDVAVLSVIPSQSVVVQGETMTITVNVANQGTFDEAPTVSVYYGSALIGFQSPSISSGSVAEVLFSWDTTGVEAGSYTISALASIPQDDEPTDNEVTSGPITVTNFAYTLNIEIDYMPGHEPTPTVLTYMQTYYAQEGIALAFDIADSPVPLDLSVSTSDFWKLERLYNSGPDRANGSPYNGKYDIPYKWVLFGTKVQGSASTVGYCYTLTVSGDLLAGNYIYIADLTADNWAGSSALQTGAEAVLLMHEFGHSIGIAILSAAGGEVYCSDSTCVMSYLNSLNAGDTNRWHYCEDHWATRNMGYYSIAP